MKFAYTIPFFLVTLLLITGCGRDDRDDYQGKNVVRKSIIKPSSENPPKAEVCPAKAEPLAEATATPEIETPQIQGSETETPVESDNRFFITTEGDTLSGISANPSVYNNPLKWTFLYRDNIDALSMIKGNGKLYENALSTNIKLKIATPDSIKKNLDTRPKAYYTVNVLSSPSLEELGPNAVKLIEAGYYVYMASAIVRDKTYYRLRTGFYNTRSEADKEGDQIKKLLNITDVWTAKIDDAEFSDFGGY